MANKRVYHWTAAVRIEHWWHVAAMATLIFTGFYIHMPFLQGGGESMAWMRFGHFVSMYVLIFGLIVRTYLAFNSHTAADWKELMPLPSNLANIPDMLGYYMFLKDTHKPYKRYNPLQGLAYFIMGLIILVMAATGFALYDGWLSTSFAWVNVLLCGDEVTRVVHYLGMWLLICLTIVHIYFVLREEMVEKDRTFMSMVDGYKEVGE
ncbi:MAG TPA: Ni/Fe-hydrogenase, b-type cytochrome subunit [Nitrospirota bacterium]